MPISPSTPILSNHPKRQKIYQDLLTLSIKEALPLSKIVKAGEQLMRQARLHHHFFGDLSLYQTSLHLALFALSLPYDYQNKKQLNILLNQEHAAKIIEIFERRIAERLPVEYITHEATYLDYLFYVNEHVLVPRSIMNTRFQDFLTMVTWQNGRVLDLCTGSGCIGISLALLQPNIKVDLADISSDALIVADINIKKFNLEQRVQTIHSDLFEQITQTYDLIITNPPYVSIKDYQNTPIEFKKEPKLALESGQDGLDIIREIFKKAKKYLSPEGLLIAEVGYASAKLIKREYKKIPLTWFAYRRPNGKESWLGMDGIFLCHAKDLP